MNLGKMKKENPERFNELKKIYHLTSTTDFIKKHGYTKSTLIKHFGKKSFSFKGKITRVKKKGCSRLDEESPEHIIRHNRIKMTFFKKTRFYIKDESLPKNDSLIGYGLIKYHNCTILFTEKQEGSNEVTEGVYLSRFVCKNLADVKKYLKVMEIKGDVYLDKNK